MKTRKLKIKSFFKYPGANIREAIRQDGGISPIGLRCCGDMHSFGDSGSQRTAILINSKRFFSMQDVRTKTDVTKEFMGLKLVQNCNQTLDSVIRLSTSLKL